ncbi:hypothetical protein [Rhizobium sullae]|uniref:Uncharacterized protein n=1 Tax=Rhizobium sullae TaxID=50338 RepID=A0A4R3PUV3_RHISU|nr:hypothetical protein [Rhizobium sullae]TCU02119.1 hypothetical protein EV132_1648 [Rhizobium sullae]
MSLNPSLEPLCPKAGDLNVVKTQIIPPAARRCALVRASVVRPYHFGQTATPVDFESILLVYAPMEKKMSHHFAFETTVVTSEGLALLEHVLERWCQERGLDMTSPKAKVAARELVDLFQFGVRKEKELDYLLRHTH